MRNSRERPKAALIWLDIGHYHAARSNAAFAQSALAVETVEVFESAGFSEFRAAEEARSGFTQHGLRLPRDSDGQKLRAHLNSKLDALRPDVVFVPGWSLAPALVALEWCADNGTACVIMSDTVSQAQPRISAKEALKKRLVGLGQAAFVSGAAAANYVRELGMPRELISSGFDTIDNDHFANGAAEARRDAAAVRRAFGLPDRYLLVCARLIPEKNIPRLLEAYAKHFAVCRDAVLPIVQVGPGPLQQDIETLVAKLGLQSHFIMHGARDYKTLPKYYGLAEALLLPSVSEAWGLVVNEAMAASLPVLVSSRCGCSHDLVEDGKNGFVFDPFDVDSIADTLARFARLPDAKRAAMGVRSREIISHWGLDHFVQGFDTAARAALAAHRRKPTLLDRLLLKALTLQ